MTCRSASLGWLFCAVLLPSCSSLLGIEELHEEEAGAGVHGGAAGSSGSAGGSGTSGRDASKDAEADASGAAGSGGSAEPVDAGDAAEVNVPSVTPDAGAVDASLADARGADASLGDARADAVPDAGVADALVSEAGRDAAVEAGPVLITVRGHLIDAWRHDVPGTPIVIGTKTATTDATGHFEIADVAAPYDVLFVISGSVAGKIGTQGWVYQGLRRADPTLQVYAGVAGRSNSMQARFANVPDPLPATADIFLAFGSPDGSGGTDTNNSVGIDYGPINWRGPAKTTGTLHGLRINRSSTEFDAPPSAYLGYDSAPLTLDDAAPSNQVNLNLVTKTIPSANITGTVAGLDIGDPSLDAWLVFSSNGVMHLLRESKGAGAFSYLLPTIAGSTVTISAQRGSINYPPYSIVHSDGLTPGQSAGTLNIPAAPTALVPISAATGVTAATTFTWSGATGLATAVFSFSDLNMRFNVVTLGTSAKIPTLPASGLDLPKNTTGVWYIETHGPYATIDDAAGPLGMIDPFRSDGDYERPPTPSRLYTESESRAFTTAP